MISIALTLFLGLTSAVTVPSTCTAPYEAGTDTVLFTVPYTYDQVLSIIGDYGNLTWSGSPAGSVTLNGTDNTVGTARTYDLDGAHVIETILLYSKPPAPGPYQEVHNTALLSIPSANLSVYIPYDGTVVTSVCGGRASAFNFTAHYCANNATGGGAALHQLHLGDAMTVGTFLGGKNFTSCAALGGTNSTGPANATGAIPSATATGTMGTMTPYPSGIMTASASRQQVGVFGGVAAVLVGFAML